MNVKKEYKYLINSINKSLNNIDSKLDNVDKDLGVIKTKLLIKEKEKLLLMGQKKHFNIFKELFIDHHIIRE